MNVNYYHFDQHGNCLGYVDRVGHYFDPVGQYRGSLSRNGDLYDEDGTLSGRVDARRQVWNEEGSCRGYLVDATAHDGSEVPHGSAPALESPGADSIVQHMERPSSSLATTWRPGIATEPRHKLNANRAGDAANGGQRNQRLAEMGAAVTRIVHDLGNPLSGLALQAEVILRSLQKEPNAPSAVIREPAQQILSTIRRLDDYVRALLDFSRGRELQLQPLRLGPFLQDIVGSWQPTAAAHTISIHAHVEDTDQVLADGMQLRRVFDNLVKNAIEAIGNGPGNIAITVTAEGEAMGISVEDTGPGAADYRRLFRPFYTTKCEGTGLGLAVAKQIIEAHDGRIAYAQRRPHGAVFRISLRRYGRLDPLARYATLGFDEA